MGWERLVGFSVLNFVGLACLILLLIKRGNDWVTALRASWKLVIVASKDPGLAHEYPAWTGLLVKTWWLMNLCYLGAWLIWGGFIFATGLLVICLLHFVWYLAGSRGSLAFSRVIPLNRRFGVIFHEIGVTAETCGRSLAELDLRKKDLLVLAVERDGRMNPFPKGLEVLTGGDRLVIFGDLNSFQAVFGPDGSLP